MSVVETKSIIGDDDDDDDDEARGAREARARLERGDARARTTEGAKARLDDDMGRGTMCPDDGEHEDERLTT
jgi:hypothetical protein